MTNLDLPTFDPEKHHAKWKDLLGREYEAGDIVAYAVMNYRSAELGVGMVRRINKVDSKGKLIQVKIGGDYQNPIYGPSCTVTIAPLQKTGYSMLKDTTIGHSKIVLLDIGIGDVLDNG